MGHGLTQPKFGHGSLSNITADDHTLYVLADGSRALSDTWDVQTAVTSKRFQSDVATGTAPLTVTSTTNVAGLNADLLSGTHGAFFHVASNFDAGNLPYARMPSGSDTWAASPTIAGNLVVSSTFTTKSVRLQGSVSASNGNPLVGS